MRLSNGGGYRIRTDAYNWCLQSTRGRPLLQSPILKILNACRLTLQLRILLVSHTTFLLKRFWMISAISKLKRQKIHSQASSIALSEQTRQRYLCLLSSTNLPFGWWTLTNRRPTNSLMELLFPELKTHYRLMLDSNSRQTGLEPVLCFHWPVMAN